MISLLATLSIVSGCGVMPAEQSSSRAFTVRGFSLPVAMVYTRNVGESSRVSGIASDKAGAQAFVERLVMQTVFDVLERQGRSALLSDAVISAILSQLTVNTTYEPMECQAVALSRTEKVDMMAQDKISQRCIIVGSTVTGVCTHVKDGEKKCDDTQGNVMITRVPDNVTTITGTLRV
ncbi:hypothetical protein KIN20_013086 [Parelaphostrongylus tenuis]|uniref:Uncharacterized protein n=1 Tax=Parelaphostrongylus tenuis TaxID=148309 RepID=A0AAD5MBN7_PARTN|nr:hypothetical protein KIN20_013086 [Parelaphostrongylus tenuis]